MNFQVFLVDLCKKFWKIRMLYHVVKWKYPNKYTFLVKEKAITVSVNPFTLEGSNGSGLQT